MRAGSTSRRSWRTWPLVVSALVVLAAALGHTTLVRRLQARIDAREMRLLALPERALRAAAGAESGLVRAVTRDGEELSVSVRAAAAGAEIARYRMSLRQLLADVPFAREAFDLLVVADDRGAVAAQQGDETLVRNTLDGLTSRDGTALTAERLWAASSLSPVRINGRDYALACRPVALPHRLAPPGADGETARAGLLFCGIASEERRLDAALAGAAGAAAALWALAAAVLLALPLVRLLLAGPGDPVRAADVRALGTCGAAGLLALGAAALALPVTRALADRSDAALVAVASAARRNLEIEIDRLRRQAAELDRRALGQSAGRSCANVLALFGRPAVGCAALPVGALDYPYFASMSWAAENGDQVARWRTTPPEPGGRPEPDGLLSIAARDYFRAVRDDRLWPSGGARGGGDGVPFYIQSIRSLSTGRPGAALSIPSAGLGQPLMAAVTTRLLSVWDPVLPPDVGLAVVDRDGEVLFHSDPAQALTHNLLAETQDDGRLRAAVSGPADAVSSGRYWGRRHRFAAAPLREVPWTLVAFRDEAPARAVGAAAVRGALALALAYAVVAGALAWLALTVADRRGARGPWPRPSRRSAYAEATATLAVLAALWLHTLRTVPPDRAVWLAFAASAAGLALFVLAFRVSPLARAAAILPAGWRRRLDASTARWTGGLHAAALGLGAVCVAVLPGVSLAQAAAGRALHDFAARERRALQARSAARTESAAAFHGHLLRRDRATTQDGAATPDGQLLRARLAETLDLYPVRVFAEEDAAGDGAGPLWNGATRRAAPAGAPTAATAAGVLLLGASAALLVRWTTRRVQPDAVRPAARSYDDLRQGRVPSAVCLLPSGSDVDRALQGGWCRRVDVREGAGESYDDASRPVAIDLRAFAEAQDDARSSTRALAEALCDDRRRRVYLVGFRPAADLLHPPGGGWPPLAADEADAWRRLFERLETVVVRDLGDASAARDEQSAHRLLGLSAGRARVRFLAEELRAAPRLRGLADRQLPPGAFAAHDREAMVARLAEIAGDYYADLWGACAADERRVLADVCAGAFATRWRRDAAGRALDRGLAVDDPVIRPMNRSFAAFVLRQEIPAADAADERRAGWRDARLPLLVLAASCAALAWLLDAAPLRTALGVVAALPG
ncbi:MAG: cache domain-containing protein [Vicinamibacteria bacterium]